MVAGPTLQTMRHPVLTNHSKVYFKAFSIIGTATYNAAKEEWNDYTARDKGTAYSSFPPPTPCQYKIVRHA